MVLVEAAEVEILPHILQLVKVLVDLLLVLDRVELVLMEFLDLKQVMVLHS